MKIKEHYQKAKTWQRKCIIISFYHNGMMLKKKGNWTLRSTAKYFEVSMGKVSEDLNLSLNIEALKSHIKRQTALMELRDNQKKYIRTRSK